MVTFESVRSFKLSLLKTIISILWLGMTFSVHLSQAQVPVVPAIPAVPAAPATTSGGPKAQPANTNSTSLDDYFTIGLRYNQTPFVVNAGNLNFSYVDESPSRDNLQTSKNWNESAQLGFFELLLGVGNYKTFHVELGGGYGENGDFRRFDFVFGIGGNKTFGPKNRLGIRYVLPMRYGNVRQYVGKIQNNASYIQVNEKQFYSPEVKVFLKTNPFIINPRVDICLRLTNWLSIEMGGGYQVNVFTTGTRVRFDGKDGTGEEASDITETEKLNASNLKLRYNGSGLSKLPMKLNGFFFNAGLFFGNTRGF